MADVQGTGNGVTTVVEAVNDYDTERVLTVPNVLSLIRLLGVPLFCVWILQGRYIAAIVVLALSSVTDMLDGRIARALHQRSRLGQQLDPLADRLYILACVVALALRGLIPWWFLALLAGRDVAMLTLTPTLRKLGYSSLPVNFVGKAATFCLLIALPLVLFGATTLPLKVPAAVLGQALGLWGLFLYWWSGALYISQARSLANRVVVAATRER